MRRYQRYTVLFAALAVTGCLLACGGGASGQKPAEPPAKTAEAAGTEEKETVSESGEKKESAGAPMAQKKSGSGDKDGAEEKASLAERLEGRYSYAYPPAEDDAERMEEGEREYYTLELVNFGGNLFATGGIARTESPEEEKEAYSFWGMEMIPVMEGALLDRSADSCEVGILTWSVMSNLEKYWDRPAYGSIELTEDGVAFTGKDGADNPLMEGAARVEFVRDDTVPAELSANPEMLSEHDRGGDSGRALRCLEGRERRCPPGGGIREGGGECPGTDRNCPDVPEERRTAGNVCGGSLLYTGRRHHHLRIQSAWHDPERGDLDLHPGTGEREDESFRGG